MRHVLESAHSNDKIGEYAEIVLGSSNIGLDSLGDPPESLGLVDVDLSRPKDPGLPDHPFREHFQHQIQKQKLKDILFVFLAQILELIALIDQVVDQRNLLLLNIFILIGRHEPV